jgi:FkbM family methyltransferase
MTLIEKVTKPEYLFRPLQVYRRVTQMCKRREDVRQRVTLPWGLVIGVHPQDAIGRAIWKTGVFELSVTEVLWRLIDEGDTVVDVGANIGYMTSVMGIRAGGRGQVIAFEPNPEVFRELTMNVDEWARLPGVSPIVPHRLALGSQPGWAILGNWRASNRGMARIVSSREAAGVSVEIRVERLDNIVEADRHIGVVKIDVEGYELNVLKGAGDLIEKGLIRDIVFEDERPYPTSTTQYLEDHGYTIFSIRQRLLRPIVRPAATTTEPLRRWEAQNFVGTRKPARVRERCERKGWHSLSRWMSQ